MSEQNSATTVYKRPAWDEYFMEIARVVGKRATCDRGRSGAIIVRENHILVTGYVGAPRGIPDCDQLGHLMKTVTHEDGRQSQHCMRGAHAEQNAIVQAARIGISIKDGTLYTRMTPCAACAKMVINAGIVKIVCERRYHAGDESEQLFKMAGIEIKFLEDTIEQYANQ